MFTAAFLEMAKRWEQVKCPLIDDKGNVLYTYNVRLFTLKMEGTSDTIQHE